MVAERFADRPVGTSSRLRYADGPSVPWVADNGVVLALPVVLDLVHKDEESGLVAWWVEATVGVLDTTPVLTSLTVCSPIWLDVEHLQREFRWATPIDVVTRLVPRMIADGRDPFTESFPFTGFPDVIRQRDVLARKLTDEFLEDIARQYLVLGRGYARKLACKYSVTPRTATSWVEKARTRGILTRATAGRVGGDLVPRQAREGDG